MLFQIPRSDQTKITFGKVLEHFPTKYDRSFLHFRFKKEDSAFGYVWLDARASTDVLPLYKGSIVAKVLKLDDLNSSKRAIRLRRKQASGDSASAATKTLSSRFGAAGKHSTHYEEDDEPEHEEPARVPYSDHPGPSAPVPAPASSPTPAASTQRTSGKTSSVTSPTQASAPTVAPAPVAPAVVSAPVNLLDDFASSDTPAPAPSLQHPDDNMLDFGTADTKSPAGKKTPSSSSSSSSKETGIETPTGTGGLTREELKARRQEAIDDKVKEALEFKMEVDDIARREAEELEVAKAKYDRALDQWATNNKEKRNVRTLLSTMHTVLWPENNWKPIGLGDVIDASKVRVQHTIAPDLTSLHLTSPHLTLV